jgi:predicted metalloendopeptidase
MCSCVYAYMQPCNRTYFLLFFNDWSKLFSLEVRKYPFSNTILQLPIHPDQYFENVLNILQHLTREEQNLLGTPVNKSLWNTAPAVVNAYYSRSKNQISEYISFQSSR